MQFSDAKYVPTRIAYEIIKIGFYIDISLSRIRHISDKNRDITKW